MIYFYTDVLLNYHVEQEPAQHEQARHLYQRAIQTGQAFVSLLTLNELVFILARLQVEWNDISTKIAKYEMLAPAGYTPAHFHRAMELAERVGFEYITECLHTAIAEAHCDQLYTYNRGVFSRVQKHSPLTISIF